jgi:hypothetical protein
MEDKIKEYYENPKTGLKSVSRLYNDLKKKEEPDLE